jgi:putative phosphoribosyl transferase
MTKRHAVCVLYCHQTLVKVVRKAEVMSAAASTENLARDVQIPSGSVMLSGELALPAGAQSVVLFAHGSGSSRWSPRNQFVARVIRGAGVGTLLLDLLTKEEEHVDADTGHIRFDIGLLAERLIDATYWIKGEFDYLRVGYFGASTGGGAALVAAAELGTIIGAVVSRGGRPDLAGDALPLVNSPTLLIVGGLDYSVIEMNQRAYAQLRCEKELKIVPGATHLFEEPGALEQVAQLAADWFRSHLVTQGRASTSET